MNNMLSLLFLWFRHKNTSSCFKCDATKTWERCRKMTDKNDNGKHAMKMLLLTNSLKNKDALNAKDQGKRRQTLTTENTNNSSRLGMSSLLSPRGQWTRHIQSALSSHSSRLGMSSPLSSPASSPPHLLADSNQAFQYTHSISPSASSKHNERKSH